MPEAREDRGFRVTGRVQGVGFRWWARSHALRLGLRGQIRNLPDGSVEVRASGGPAALERFRELLRQGPPGARVEAVAESRVEPVNGDRFEITG